MKSLAIVLIAVAVCSAQVFMDVSANIAVDGQETVDPLVLVDVSQAEGAWLYTVGMGYRAPETEHAFDPTVTVEVGVARSITEAVSARFRLVDIPLVDNGRTRPRVQIGASFRL